MAHESFEDGEVAEYLNRYYVAIKVDKEERPDIDSIYMNVCQNMTGSGGWPLSIIMLPDQKPFFAGTYFPKKAKHHMPGLLDLLGAAQEKWENNREDLIKAGEEITDSLKQELNEKTSDIKASKKLIQDAANHLTGFFDKQYGGFGRAPKFPTAHNLIFLLRYFYYEQKEEALKAVEKTLDCMYQGGIFDHIGYGFSRYSTDSMWLVPHFEKMLYDNALLILSYLEAYQITKKVRYRQIAEKTMEYVLRELTCEDGGFYCAQDADSEGAEGKYYVFTPDEIIDLLGVEDGNYFNDYFGITKRGNFEGSSIPNRIHAEKPHETKQFSPNSQSDLADDRIQRLRKIVYEYRLHRTELHKDDKILTSWNGIMIAAFAKAYEITRDKRYLQAAQKADQFLQNHLSKEDGLFVFYRDGIASGQGHIDDYAFYSFALIGLYEATFELSYLERAIRYTKVLLNKFFDPVNGGFYLYADDAETLIQRPKELYDGAIPSGNSVAAYVLLKLSNYTGDSVFMEMAEKQINFIANGIAGYPSAYCFGLMAMMQIVYPTRELICTMPDADNVSELRDILTNHYLPDVAVLALTKQNRDQLVKVAEYTKDYEVRDKPCYYLCENHTCRAPVFDSKEMVKLLIN